LSNASTEMNRITDTLPDGRGARHLIAFLPGAWDVAEAFQRFGFVSQVRKRGLAADIVAVDSQVGHFNDGSIAERVRDEIVVPARAAGYRSIWLVGISLGGLGSMLCASRHPGVDGIVALAPYLATRDVMAEVRRAGGLAVWAGTREPAFGDWERRLLAWLAAQGSNRPGAQAHPELILAYGLQDRFADSLALLAPVLDPTRVVTTAGGHDWDTWIRLWTMVLDRHAPRLAPPLSPRRPAGPR
jgi:pimeloyl-ACP methyl ester carboxylesterase